MTSALRLAKKSCSSLFLSRSISAKQKENRRLCLASERFAQDRQVLEVKRLRTVADGNGIRGRRFNEQQTWRGTAEINRTAPSGVMSNCGCPTNGRTHLARSGNIRKQPPRAPAGRPR